MTERIGDNLQVERKVPYVLRQPTLEDAGEAFREAQIAWALEIADRRRRMPRSTPAMMRIAATV